MLYPVYKGTYERPDGTKRSAPSLTSNYRDHVIMWAKDASRAIDYAETRTWTMKSWLTMASWGAELGGIIPATDPRIRVCVFALGGLLYQRTFSEVDNINFPFSRETACVDVEWPVRLHVSGRIILGRLFSTVGLAQRPEKTSSLRHQPQSSA